MKTFKTCSKKIFAMLLAFALVMSSFSGTTLTAKAEEASAEEIVSETVLSEVADTSAMTVEEGSDIVDNGYCGVVSDADIEGISVTWTLTANEGSTEEAPDYTLNIAGTGAMADFVLASRKSSAPWVSYISYITSIVIEEGVTTVGDYSFYNCTNLAQVSLPEGITEIGAYAFYGCKLLAAITIPNSVTTIGARALYNCQKLEELSIPNSVTTLGERAFGGLTITEISIPDSVTSIGENLFYGCKSLAKVTIGKGITEINTGMFYNCQALTEATVPEGIISIGDKAFYGCLALASVTLPKTLNVIGEKAFYNCTVLANVFYSGTTAKWNTILIGTSNDSLTAATLNTAPDDPNQLAAPVLSSSAADRTMTSITLTAPASSEQDTNAAILYQYKLESDKVWSEWQESPVFENLKVGKPYHFRAMYKADEASEWKDSEASNVITLRSVDVINEGTCGTNLTYVLIDSGNGYSLVIEGYGEMDCGSWPAWGNWNYMITSVSLPDGLTSIDYNAFQNFKMTEIKIPDTVTTIDKQAFYICGNLTSVVIPDGVTTIGENAFSGCGSLTSVTIPTSVKTIGNYAFYQGDKGEGLDVYYCGTPAQWNEITMGGTRVWGYRDYTIHYNTWKLNFDITPADAEILVKDKDGNVVEPITEGESSVYHILKDTECTYIISRNGYIPVEETFTPDSDKTIAVTLEEGHVGAYKINIADSSNGSVTAGAEQRSEGTADEGDKVNVKITCNPGYEVKEVSVADANGNSVEVTDNSFTMPASDVTVTVAFEANWYGKGMESGNYVVSTLEEFEQFAAVVNGTDKNIPVDDFSGETVTLGADISLNGEWTSIGTKETPFKGTFDGDSHTINGLTITKTNGFTVYSGLFGYVDGGKIQNVTVEGNINIEGLYEYATKAYVGGVAGYAPETAFNNCTNKVKISVTPQVSKVYIGGIAAYGQKFVGCENYSDISVVCTNYKNIDRDDPVDMGYVGGIAGISTELVDQCVNYGNLNAQFVGGICYQAKGTVKSSTNKGNVTFNNEMTLYIFNPGAAGIVFFANDTLAVSDCYNTGDIVSKQTTTDPHGYPYAAGIVASNNADTNAAMQSNVTITNCYNTGTLTRPNPTSTVRYGEIAPAKCLVGTDYYGYQNVDSLIVVNNSYMREDMSEMTVPEAIAVLGEAYKDSCPTPALSWETPAEHTGAVLEKVEPTCGATGLEEGAICSVCNTILVEQEVIPATGNHSWEFVPAVEATCTETGLTMGIKCSECDKVLLGQGVTDKKGHTEETIEAVEATCTETGLTEGSKCSECGEILTAQEEVSALGHSFGEWYEVKASGCTDEGSERRDCSACEYFEIRGLEAEGHVWEEDFTVDKEATCTEDGSKSIHCEKCDAQKDSEVISAAGHVVVIDKAVEVTCDEPGLTEGSHCSTCGEVIEAQEEIKAPGHKWVYAPAVEATCTETGLTMGIKCTTCGEDRLGQSVIEAKGHTEVIDEAVEATCDESGLTEGSHCSTCGEVFKVQEEVKALGHNEVIDEAVEATCDEKGLTEGSHCSTCGEVFKAQEEVKALGHDWVYAPAVEATCTETGLTMGIKCTVCEDTLLGQSVIEAKGHTEVIDEAVEATCTEVGFTEGSHCSECGEVLKAQEEIKAKGHTEVVDKAVEATCSEMGLTEGKHCSECGEVIVEQKAVKALGHKLVYLPAVEVTCTEDGLTMGIQCKVCEETLLEQTVIEAEGHKEVTDKAVEVSCTESGLTEGSHCSECGEVFKAQEEIPALGHKEVIDEAAEATCTESGLTEGKHCSVCDEVLKAQEEIPALGHKEVIDEAAEATCTESGLTEGKHCSVCDKVLKAQKEIPALGHIEEVVAGKAATCTEAGLTEGKQCYACGEVFVAQEEIAAAGHSYGEWSVVESANCIENGSEQRECSVCKHIETNNLDANGHAWEEEFTVDKEAACAEDGSKSIHCVNCDAQKDSTVIPAAGHNYGEWTVITEPTYTEAGLKEQVCEVCGNKQTQEIEKTAFAMPFIDVPEGSWYYDAVAYACMNGITMGTTDTTFSPNKICTRAEIVTFLWRAYGEQAAENATCEFTDVKAGSYYEQAVLWAIENGITVGTSETTFSPNDICTREQIVTFLWRANGEQKAEAAESVFTDVDIERFSYDAILWAVENEITAGTSATEFSPLKDCTRAEAVTFIARALN